jgi:ribose transport system substrate-binding protein
MNRWRKTGVRLVILLAVFSLIAAACSSDDDSSDTTAATETTEAATETTAAAGETYTIGVSNTLVGNSWREQMVCAIKAEARVSGVVDRVILDNRNMDTTEQIAGIQGLISQGVDAIIVNPSDRSALDPVLEEASSQGIVVVSIDAPVTAPSAYVVTNDQVAYGEVGARWLFETLGGEGNIVYMRGIDGHPADTDRDTGFQSALADYPDITYTETFTGWDPSVGAQQALDLLGTQEIDGIWTSGVGYTVVPTFEVAGVPFVPVVGADNNLFLGQLLQFAEGGLTGVAVTNPPAIGGVGAAIAISALKGENPDKETILTPEPLSDPATLEATYIPALAGGWSPYMEISPWTSYTAGDVVECLGPGE